jgi:hypothetical protein
MGSTTNQSRLAQQLVHAIITGPICTTNDRGIMGHPAIYKCSLETLRVNGHFCGVTLDSRSLYFYI